MLRVVAFALILFAVLILLLPPDADGCAAVRRSDRPEDYVRIAEESAVIVWDPVKKIEHFIRSAAFDTKSPDFGFLVPTPSMPTLKEANGQLFHSAASWIAPRVVEQTRMKYDPLLCMCCLPFGCSKPAGGMKAAAVRVLHEQKVGGYDAAILAADNTQDLADWLKKNKYSNDPELQSWLFPYVAAKWKITAFKISQDPAGALADTRPVRMSFATERPFFPYREPESKPQTDAEKKAAQVRLDKAKRENTPRQFHIDEKGNHIWNDARLLRVFFVSDTRMDGKLGNVAWHASVGWSDELTENQRLSLAHDAGISKDDLPAKIWMTAFEDSSSPRPGKDEVYFEPAKDRTPIRPPDIIRYHYEWIPIDLVVLVLHVVAGIAVAIIWKRGRSKTPPAAPQA